MSGKKALCGFDGIDAIDEDLEFNTTYEILGATHRPPPRKPPVIHPAPTKRSAPVRQATRSGKKSTNVEVLRVADKIAANALAAGNKAVKTAAKYASGKNAKGRPLTPVQRAAAAAAAEAGKKAIASAGKLKAGVASATPVVAKLSRPAPRPMPQKTVQVHLSQHPVGPHSGAPAGQPAPHKPPPRRTNKPTGKKIVGYGEVINLANVMGCHPHEVLGAMVKRGDIEVFGAGEADQIDPSTGVPYSQETNPATGQPYTDADVIAMQQGGSGPTGDTGAGGAPTPPPPPDYSQIPTIPRRQGNMTSLSADDMNVEYQHVDHDAGDVVYDGSRGYPTNAFGSWQMIYGNPPNSDGFLWGESPAHWVFFAGGKGNETLVMGPYDAKTTTAWTSIQVALADGSIHTLQDLGLAPPYGAPDGLVTMIYSPDRTQVSYSIPINVLDVAKTSGILGYQTICGNPYHSDGSFGGLHYATVDKQWFWEAADAPVWATKEADKKTYDVAKQAIDTDYNTAMAIYKSDLADWNASQSALKKDAYSAQLQTQQATEAANIQNIQLQQQQAASQANLDMQTQADEAHALAQQEDEAHAQAMADIAAQQAQAQYAPQGGGYADQGGGYADQGGDGGGISDLSQYADPMNPGYMLDGSPDPSYGDADGGAGTSFAAPDPMSDPQSVSDPQSQYYDPTSPYYDASYDPSGGQGTDGGIDSGVGDFGVE